MRRTHIPPEGPTALLSEERGFRLARRRFFSHVFELQRGSHTGIRYLQLDTGSARQRRCVHWCSKNYRHHRRRLCR